MTSLTRPMLTTISVIAVPASCTKLLRVFTRSTPSEISALISRTAVASIERANSCAPAGGARTVKW
jgi:hypothetical protein